MRQFKIRSTTIIMAAISCALGSSVIAVEPGVTKAKESIDWKKVQTSIERGLAIVEKGAANYPKHRKCFSCHHQTLPVFAMTQVGLAGGNYNSEVLKQQTKFTFDSFHRRMKKLREGTGIGGTGLTVAYGLWSLKMGKHKPDKTTDAMIDYLMKVQHQDGSWHTNSNRPPLEESRVTVTVTSVYMMKLFATENNKSRIDAVSKKAAAWLKNYQLKSHEDYISALWGTKVLGLPAESTNKIRDHILSTQHTDGGWSQLPGMDSDAYATGQAVYGLRGFGQKAQQEPLERGIRFLLKSQNADGSWLVKTRSKPVQVYFDNGDPHGKSQFISIAATSWAVAALAANSPRKPNSK